MKSKKCGMAGLLSLVIVLLGPISLNKSVFTELDLGISNKFYGW